jgi:hypothetical protein
MCLADDAYREIFPHLLNVRCIIVRMQNTQLKEYK